jgi:predicted aspartyl protease
MVLGKSYSNTSNSDKNIIQMERTDYGLIFTDILINGHTAKAMIDFGDAHFLQISSTLTEKLNLPTEKAGYAVADVFGNTWDVYQGNVQKVTIGNQAYMNVDFTSQPGEMEAVSEQIEKRFDAVIGWGLFSQYFTELDYTAGEIILHNQKPEFDKSASSTHLNTESGYLIISVLFEGEPINLMVDTGAPATFIDTRFFKNHALEKFTFQLGNHTLSLAPQLQDLSVLDDLDVVGILGDDFLSAYRILIDNTQNRFTIIELP